jgi:hypothetical protein
LSSRPLQCSDVNASSGQRSRHRSHGPTEVPSGRHGCTSRRRNTKWQRFSVKDFFDEGATFDEGAIRGMAAAAVIAGVQLSPAAPHTSGDVGAVHHDMSPDASGLFDPDCCFFVSAGQASRPRNRNPWSENGCSLRSLSSIASSLGQGVELSSGKKRHRAPTVARACGGCAHGRHSLPELLMTESDLPCGGGARSLASVKQQQIAVRRENSWRA